MDEDFSETEDRGETGPMRRTIVDPTIVNVATNTDDFVESLLCKLVAFVI